VDNESKSHRVLKTFRLHRDIEDIYVFLSTEIRADFDRFMMIFKSGESELFEWNNNTMVNVDGEMEKTEVLLYVEQEKQREHDSQLTGYDYNKFVNLLVTSDSNGMLRLWTRDKKFIREILFPHPIDSVCFLNTRGDLLVSHEERISVIKFDTYWTKSFDHFGLTKFGEESNRRPGSANSQLDHFEVPLEPAKKLLILEDVDLMEVLQG
jgi:WD40 repeat protein